MEDGNPVADVLHVGQEVPREHDGLALLAEVPDQLLDLGRADRVQAGGRLVEQDQLGIVDQRRARPIRRCMPLEYSRSWRCLAPVNPTISINWPTRLVRSLAEILNSRP